MNCKIASYGFLVVKRVDFFEIGAGKKESLNEK